MGKCKGCGREIIWIMTRSGKAMPCDPEPVPYYSADVAKPNAKLVRFDGSVVNGYVGDVIDYAPEGFGYIPHWSTCPVAGQFKRMDPK